MSLMLVGASAWRRGDAPVAGVTFDPSTLGADVTLSNANLTATGASGTGTGASRKASCNGAKTGGLLYFEVTVNAVSNAGGAGDPFIGVGRAGIRNDATAIASSNQWSGQGRFNNALGGSGSVGGFVVNDVICFAVRVGDARVWVRKNGNAWAGGGDPAADTTPHKTLAGSGALHLICNIANAAAVTANFAGPFAQSVPSGFSAWG